MLFEQALAFCDIVSNLLRASGCCAWRTTLARTNASMTRSSRFLRCIFSEGFSSSESHVIIPLRKTRSQVSRAVRVVAENESTNSNANKRDVNKRFEYAVRQLNKANTPQ